MSSGNADNAIDLNIRNYNISELYAILQLDEDETPTKDEIEQTANNYISRFEREGNYGMANFFDELKTKLLDSYPIPSLEEKQTDEWYENQVLPQAGNPVQENKVTDRKQKIDVYKDGDHVPMKREQLGVNNVIDTKVAQDVLNPNLENITTRFINLDSQFRQAAGGVDAMSTDYTLDLSDHLDNVLSMRLYSIQIPFTWYTIDYPIGNTCFWVTNGSNSFNIGVTPGNYTSTNFVSELNKQILNAGFLFDTSASAVPVSVNLNNSKITINLDQWTDPSGNLIDGINPSDVFDSTVNPFFTFFDFTGEKNCLPTTSYGCISNSFKFNSTLGWLMGFRTPEQAIYKNPGNQPEAVIDLYGPKYFILVIDDYNQNHINNGLISITELPTILSMPSYYTPTLPVSCSANASGNFTNGQLAALANISPQDALLQGINPTNIGNILLEKVALTYSKTPSVRPTAPRTLTQAQIYTINQILKSREQTTKLRGSAPTASDTFALIPIKHGGMSTGDLYVDFSGSLQDNKRIYFGPVDIDRMHVRLLDDKGNVVNLHGADWCVTIITENLYQY